MVIAIDFDGTITAENVFPLCGDISPDCVTALKLLKSQGHTLILYTCRENVWLKMALLWMRERCIRKYFDYINENTIECKTQFERDCRKINADMFIDDRNFGGFTGWLSVIKYFQTEE